MNEKLIEAFEDSIKHWQRMLKWANKQPGDGKVNNEIMFDCIGESWFQDSCAVCKIMMGCECCVLNDEPEMEVETCSLEWQGVNDAETWGGWRLKAKDMIKRLKKELKAIPK